MEWLKNLREANKRKFGSMAGLSGITQSSYQSIEKGPIGPRERVLIAIWRDSGLKAEELLRQIEREILEADEALAKELLERIRKRKKDHGLKKPKP